MEYTELIPIFVAMIVGFPGVLAYVERRLDKRDAAKIAAALAKTKAEEDARTQIFREVTARLAEQHQQQTNGMDERLRKLEVELQVANAEIARLKAMRSRSTK